jgi:chemotaxis protein histidine kinase CheA/CheY-like chemotaxis protein
MSNSFDKLSVLDSFIEEVNSYLPEIEANLERLAQSSSGGTPIDMEAVEETYRRTHTIGGSASMMDFPGLAHVAHGMEDILGDVLDGLASLDAPTLGLLQRSFARMHRLVQGIREGVDEDAIIAEDDADYVRYRALIDNGGVQQIGNGSVSNELSRTNSAALPSEMSASSSAVMPSIDEVLASFRTTPTVSGEDIGWPEEPAPAAFNEAQAEQQQHAPFEAPYVSEQVNPSALEMLVATTRTSFAQNDVPVADPTSAAFGQNDEQALPAHIPFVQNDAPVSPSLSAVVQNNVPVTPPLQLPMRQGTKEPVYPLRAAIPGNERRLPVGQSDVAQDDTDVPSFPHVYAEMQEETQSLAAQTTSLKELVHQLRGAISIVEDQRKEFKGFLDGSKDALDRMEDWAGQVMGLNLRNSPEHVRRYLPLSVMWASNTKLKKVLDLLKIVTGGVEMTDEQLHTILAQLSTSLEACGKAFQQSEAQANGAAYILAQEAGWTPWEMQRLQDRADVRERVTFERRGDPATLRAEIEAQVREELRREYEISIREEVRQEYENRAITLAARSELEQQIRSEVRKEFEAKRQLQQSVTGLENFETSEEVESRLRSEIEIQVRQEFLNLITAGTGDILNPSLQQSLMPPEPTAPRTSNFVDQARQATGLAAFNMPGVEAPYTFPVTSTPVAPVTPPQPASVTQPASSAAAFTGDFGEEAAEIFRLEAEEHLQTISMHVAALEKEPSNRELIQGIRRATHTLKGAAGMMGFRAIADLSHISEDLLDSIMEGTTTVSSAVLSLILDTAESLDQLIMGKGTPASDEAKVQTLRARYIELLGEHSSPVGSNEDDLDIDDEVAGNATVGGVVTGAQQAETNAQRAVRGDLSVRVRLQKLDELVNLFGEMLVNRSILEERIERLNRLVADVGVSSTRLRDVGQKLESRFEAATLPSGRSVQVMPGEGGRTIGYGSTGNGNRGHVEPSHLADFDELELDRYTEFHQLARGLSEGISDMTTLSAEMDTVIRECEGVFARENRLNTTFQDRLMKARLVPLSTMTPRLYRAARAVALKQHKEFAFMLEGEDTEVDRTVNEEIAGPLLHLMRNAVNHAIETPEVRVMKGKPPAGQIKLSAAYEGNQVVITVRDDGAGIDPERVRKTAISRGLIRPDQVLSDNDVVDLIFRPGFSTAEVLSEESGRGVGLDVVRDSVSRLRGTLEVESMPGQGTAFTMKFPTSLAIQSAMMVKAGGQQFAIPTVMVEAIGRLDNFKRTTFAGRPAVLVRNDMYTLTMLSQILSLPVSNLDDKAQLLFINANGQRVALVVDEIRGKSDVVMKNLGPHLRNVHGVAGGTVMGNGRVVLILELSELLATRNKLAGSTGVAQVTSMRRETTSAPSSQQAVNSASPMVVPVSANQPIPTGADAPVLPPSGSLQAERGKYVLVVDDSPSVRRVVSNMLKQHGWEVQMARDGLEALDLISHETPAAVLLDIEMPRMDGYELIATIRAQEQYRTLPLVVLTSRAAAKHQQRAMQLGASSYVIKPYQDEELINTLNSLVYGAAAR